MGAAAICCGIASSVYAQSAVRLLPTVRSAFQQRTESIAKGEQANIFLGTASVAPKNGFPWMVSLQVWGAPRQLGHFCGGVVVDPAWVLTAAHCLVASGGTTEPARVQVMTGSNVLFAGGKILTVDRFVVHPDYRVATDRVPLNDLALLHVTGASLAPLPLLPDTAIADTYKEGNKLRIFGWGTATFRTPTPISNNLLWAFVEVVGNAKCNEPAIYNGLVTDGMFCAGLGFADACQGDSGGPAIAYINGANYLAGITSWGVGCTDRKYPGVYVNVTKYVDWIRATIGARR
ncbi:serine protease [Microbacteriaceae bacterium K1510]|nr:serine protease [Microbacteriaceae bacterium K1510]